MLRATIRLLIKSFLIEIGIVKKVYKDITDSSKTILIMTGLGACLALLTLLLLFVFAPVMF